VEWIVQKQRVLVANRPRLMRDLVLGTIRDQPDIEVVGETEDEAEITELVERMRPDYLIVGVDEQETRPALCGFLLGRYPQMKILAVGADRNRSIFYWAFIDIRSKPVETSEQGMLSVLRNGPEMART
jgi:DNA-binding NarL/FixJ family response regulator